ncbi:MAG TPA: phage baseplate assembly protein V [bacterium]|nr:phage baseplate assembly protein V [bacterium]
MKEAFGLIKEFSTDRKTVRVMLNLAGGEVLSGWLRIARRRTKGDTETDTFDLDEQVFCILNDTLDEGVVLCAVYGDEDDPPSSSADVYERKFKDGTVIKYDRSAHKLDIECKGEISVKADGPCTVEAVGKCTVKGATVDIDGGGGVIGGVVHQLSPCQVFGVCHLNPSTTTKVSG